MQGMIDDEIAEQMQIARSTLKKWEAEYKEFSDALKMGKAPVDFSVEQKLLQRAMGYTFEEKKVIVEVLKDGTQKPARIEKTTKVIAPDVTAQIFWLKNRKPKEWRDKQVMEHEGRVITGFDIIEVDEKGNDKG